MSGLLSEMAEWVRSRPPEVQETMRTFPPGCEVKATRELLVPGPGTTGRVIGYFQELKDKKLLPWARGVPPAFEDGAVEVAGINPQGVPLNGICRTDWLEVVGYDDPITPEWIGRVLRREGAPVMAGGCAYLVPDWLGMVEVGDEVLTPPSATRDHGAWERVEALGTNQEGELREVLALHATTRR